MLHMPSPMLLRALTPYEAFLENIRARTAYVLTASNSTLDTAAGSPVATGLFRLQSPNYSSSPTTIGSAWGGPVLYADGGKVAGAMRHGLPSQDEFNAQVSNLGEILIKLEGAGDQIVTGSTRNGLTTYGSADYGWPAYPAFYLTEVTYFDFALQRGRTMNPYATSGPADY